MKNQFFYLHFIIASAVPFFIAGSIYKNSAGFLKNTMPERIMLDEVLESFSTQDAYPENTAIAQEEYNISWTIDGKPYKLVQDDGLTQELIVDKYQISGYLNRGARISIRMKESTPGIGVIALNPVFGKDEVIAENGDLKDYLKYSRNHLKRKKNGSGCTSAGKEWAPFTITFTSYGEKKGDKVAGSFSGILYDNENTTTRDKCVSSIPHQVSGIFNLRKPY
jgi:hypothetical protein